jgi:hypothetical protein
MLTANDLSDLSLDGIKIEPDKLDPFVDAAIRRVEVYLNRPLKRAIYRQFGSATHEWIPIVTPAPSRIKTELSESVEYEGGYTRETLSEDIRQAIFMIAAWHVNRASHNVYGQAQKTVNTGSTSATVTVDQRNFIEKVLEGVEKHKNYQMYSWVEFVSDVPEPEPEPDPIPEGALTYLGEAVTFHNEFIIP